MANYKAIKIDGVKHDYHRWLMEQELGRKLDRNEIVHHKNENKLDNDINNLEVLSRSEHAKLHVKPPYFPENARERNIAAIRARPSPCRKLTDADAIFIKEHYIRGDRQYGARALARKFGVSHHIILTLINGKYYKNL